MNAPLLTRLQRAIVLWCRTGFVPQPAHGWEWFFMRLLLALLVFYSLQEFKPYSFDEQSVPRGLAHFFDLTFLHENGPVDFSALKRVEIPGLGTIRLHGPGWFDTVVVASAVLGVLYAWGRGLLITLPLLALLHTIPWTLSNSRDTPTTDTSSSPWCSSCRRSLSGGGRFEFGAESP